MQIRKNGEIIYNSIDNTGSSDDAALGARYAKGRIDTIESNFDNYFDKDETLDLLEQKSAAQFVNELPATLADNTWYYSKKYADGTDVPNDKRALYAKDSLGVTQYLGVVGDVDLTDYQTKLSAQSVLTVTESTKLSGLDLTTHKSMDFTVDLLTQYVANKFFPVGSLYTTASSDNPNTILGVGTWEIVATNRVLWGVDASTTAGTELEEQLPNMKGTLGGVVTYNKSSTTGVGTGVFSQSKGESSNPSVNQQSGATMGFTKFDFNAFYSSPTYKDNATVRPAAYTVHIWKRTA